MQQLLRLIIQPFNGKTRSKTLGRPAKEVPLKTNLKIQKVQFLSIQTLPVCSCIVANYLANPILPGEEGIVTATVNTFGQSGQFAE